MSWHLCWLLAIITNSYHLSLNSLNQPQAEQYCIDHCNSHLASIHSDEDYESIVNLIQRTITSDNTIDGVDTDVYVGLFRPNSSSPWQWMDGSAFDYNGSTSSYAWDLGEDNCIVIEGASDSEPYRLNDAECDLDDQIFICNDCYGLITKYAAIDDGERSQDEQSQKCLSMFNTSLASIRSDDWQYDNEEAQLLCNLVNDQPELANQNCWIGAELNSSSDEYTWNDGTKLQFGIDRTQYPWYDDGNTVYEMCVNLDREHEYLWNDAPCQNNVYGICNLPSETCVSDKWKLIDPGISATNTKFSICTPIT